MVWFDCECGESLKKPAVARHLQARRCSAVTCVDCSTTFHGNDFEAHIKCVSEAQKYLGKLYQSDSVKREGAKQDDWLTSVTTVLDEYQGPLYDYVQRLKQYDNIPRKQKAFENFVANSLNLKREPITVTKLWNIVAACIKRSDIPQAGGAQVSPWSSYEEEAIEILKRNGGSMAWKSYQASMTKRRKTAHPEEDYGSIRLNVLVNTPEKFLSSKSNSITLVE
jgi:hypothetical protein